MVELEIMTNLEATIKKMIMVMMDKEVLGAQ
jgi:hypothetical protein